MLVNREFFCLTLNCNKNKIYKELILLQVVKFVYFFLYVIFYKLSNSTHNNKIV